MSTYRSTWDADSVLDVAQIRRKDPQAFMRKLFWGVLEHDTDTARELSKDIPKNYQKLRSSLKKFAKLHRELQDMLMAATKKFDRPLTLLMPFTK